MNNSMGKRWDIFCKIVDNYGDIGVCWRLSQQLAHEHQLQIRLFIDDLSVASHIISGLDFRKPQQIMNGIEVCAWSQQDDPYINEPADVVIETFACELPNTYLQSMQSNQTVWIKLEYLSAEPWVRDFHGKPSPHPSFPIIKHYFFPSFFEDTGSLIREKDLISRRNAFLNSTSSQAEFWQKLTSLQNTDQLHDALKVSIFCYPQAQIATLLYELQNIKQSISLFLPFNSTLTTFNRLLTDIKLDIGDVIHKNNLTVHILPFLSQDDYDRLLWACDLNFVRGEDSWIRAIWAGKPFIWQPYLQADDAHIEKLDAFLNIYSNKASAEIKTLFCESSLAWSGSSDSKAHTKDNLPNETSKTKVWQRLISQLPTFHAYANQRTDTLITQPDLATKLVIFSENLRRNQV